MTHDEILRLAIEAGIPIETDWAGRPATLVVKDGGTYLRGVDDLIRFAALVAAAEREACAKLCERLPAQQDRDVRDECAAAIRKRGET